VETRDLRHIRWEPLGEKPLRSPEFSFFSSSVGFLKVAPLSFPIGISDLIADPETGESLRLLLVEGYESGTYPTRQMHSFSALIYSLFMAGIPVVLVSGSGIRATQSTYSTLLIQGKEIPVLRLYGIISETALPLLSLVMKKIAGEYDMEWRATHESDNYKLVHVRLGLITQSLRGIFRVKNILSEELREIFDQEAMFARLAQRSRLRQEIESSRRKDFRKRGSLDTKRLAITDQGESVDFSQGAFVSLSRWDFLLVIDQIVTPFERIGAGPDGFAIVSDMGFEFGYSITSSFGTKHFRLLHGEMRQKERSEPLLDAARSVLADMVSLLRDTRIADIRIERKLMTTETNPGERGMFYFEIALDEPFDRVGRDEKYSAHSYSKGEEEFFVCLRRGPEPGSGIEEYYELIRRVYRRQLLETWTKPTKALDWFLIGIFKGVTCELASLLRFDQKAVEWRRFRQNVDHERVLRQAVKCRIIESDNDYLSLRFEYYEVKPEGETKPVVEPSRSGGAEKGA